MSKSVTSTEYAIQYRFKPKGHWYTDTDTYDSFDSAMEMYAHKIKMSKEFTSSDFSAYLKYAQYWRIVKREVSEWKEVMANNTMNNIEVVITDKEKLW